MTPAPDDPRPADAAVLLDFDRDHLWHPYAPAPNPVAPYVVRRASGTRLTLAAEGGGEREVVDAMSSWWAAIHGYSHPVLVDAIRGQVGELSHVMFGGLTHEPAVELARRLVARTPPGLDRVFLSDSGSVAVEVALKMAVQHRWSLGRPDQRRILTWRGGYHGDTLFAMSVCDPDSGMHALWADVVPEQVFVPMPPPGFDAPVSDAYLAELRAAFERHHHEVAAMIVEPVVQGAGGMRFHHPAYLTHLRALCDEFDVLLIFDEIATGFGRTGRWFAAEWAGVVPDILCVGKALTGGMLSLAATLCTDAVAAGISAGEVPVLAHGPTFMGNPLGCAAAIASIDLLDRLDLPTEIARIEAGLRAGLEGVDELAPVRDVRVLGAIAVIELEGAVDVVAATEAALAEGVWIRPFGSLIYAMPPFVSTDDDVAAITRALAAAARAQG